MFTIFLSVVVVVIRHGKRKEEEEQDDVKEEERKGEKPCKGNAEGEEDKWKERREMIK